MSSPNTVRTIALGFADAEERTTWGRPTFRVRETIFAGLHDDLVILRGGRETQAARLAQDSRLRPAPDWGGDGWIAIALADAADNELPDLLSDAHQLAGGATR
ncbi:MAG: MmcQ/YjbR family DNA-binding protein [Solirubrobacteraceae bacterium]